MNKEDAIKPVVKPYSEFYGAKDEESFYLTTQRKSPHTCKLKLVKSSAVKSGRLFGSL